MTSIRVRRAVVSMVAALVAAVQTPCPAVPTPRLDERDMLAACDVAARGRVQSVTLLKRWVGDRPGVDVGYEYGLFRCTLQVERMLKGAPPDRDTITYVVEAYMEGRWDPPPPMGFVYEGTRGAVTPGTTLAVFLTLDPQTKEYRRVHFNSGFDIIEPGHGEFPTRPGQTIEAD